MRYESERDVKLRLENSVVMWERRPVIVTAAESLEMVIVQDILTERNSRVRLEALDLSPASAPLGYTVSDTGRVLFAMRKPSRRFKQGLTQENFFAFNALEKPSDREFAEMFAAAGRAPRAARMVGDAIHPFSKSIARTIMGQFPDIGEAFQSVRKGQKNIVPFHREWAVGEKHDDLCLFYRGDVVGYVGDGSVKLLPEKFYLKECLELCLR